jgi:16S rRNA A1518/A1519 N6-dimethyltransferase RsmA/KsgA/DIM1 with predicted DNA glycosylase/AP lyase activity
MSSVDAGAVLERAGIDPAARPEVISPERFAALYQLLL